VDTGTEVEGEAPRRLRKAETVLRRRTSRMIVVLESSYDQHNQAAVLRSCDCLGIQHIWIVDPIEEKGSHEKAQRKRSSKQYATKKAREKAEKRAADEAAMRQLVAEQRGEPVAQVAGGGSGEPATAEAAAEGWRRAEANAAEAEQGDGRAKMSRRISKQSAEWLSLRHFPDTPSCIAALREEGYEIWVTHLSQAAVCLDDPHLVPSEIQGSKGLAVVFGREADGVSEAMVAAADRLIYFPMDGFTESLNLSVSAALVLQMILRDNPELKGAMPQEERAGAF
jgi:tRNA G18 (ribose-2'-O)-methylase SpoU